MNTLSKSRLEKKILAPRENDEYPVVWFEPKMNHPENEPLKTLFQKNQSIHLSSNYLEALWFADNLGISFLVIASNTWNEEDLTEEFGLQTHTYGRRLLELEEQSVLAELLPGITNDQMRSLKVYAFFTNNDFENEAPLDENEEEVIILPDIQDMAKRFREEFLIIWCDPEMTSENREIMVKEFDIAEENILTDYGDFLKKIHHYNQFSYHLILSGKIKAEQIFDKIDDDLKGLISAYIYGTPNRIHNQVRIEETLEKLLPRIKEGIRTGSIHKNAFPVYATNFDERDKSHINKVHYYLEGFVNFKSRKQAKSDFMKLAKRIYQNNKLLEFEKEYDEYARDSILKWYTSDSPVYKLINNCLRIASSDSILYCRFILKDLERAIREKYQQKETKRFNGLVYRGTSISEEEFKTLESNRGKEIEMYGFLSTSADERKALNFIPKANAILITIIVSPFPDPIIDEQGFINVSGDSEFAGENEILFNVRSRFQILYTEQTKRKRYNEVIECKHVVLFYGPQLLRQYMTKEKPRISMEFKRPLELKCHFCCLSVNDLFILETTQKIICKECFMTDPIPKNTFLFPISEKMAERIEIKGKILKFDEIKKNSAPVSFYGYKCYDCLGSKSKRFYKWINIESGDVVEQCVECLKKNKGKLNSVLLSEERPFGFWNKEQDKWEKLNTAFKGKEAEQLRTWKIAYIFFKTQEYRQCKEHFEKELKRLAKKRRREGEKEEYYEILGRSCKRLGEHQKALQYHMTALNMRLSIYGPLHPETALSYNNLASVYESLGEHQEAINYHMLAWWSSILSDGEEAFSTATSYNNLAESYHRLGENQVALDFHLSALEITKKEFGNQHPNTANSYGNISAVYFNLGQSQKALEYQSMALEIRKSFFGELHSDVATSYCAIGSIHNLLGDSQQGLGYYLKALDIRESIHGEMHSNTANSYSMLGSAYHNLGEYQKALEYHEKALKIVESIHGESHPMTSDVINNLADCYFTRQEYSKSLEYQFRSLNIAKSIYGEAHNYSAISYNNIALVYHKMGEHQKALEFAEKAFDITKSLNGEKHHLTASVYNSLAAVYESLGRYQQAIEYHLKAIEIKEFILGEMHPSTAKSYSNLGVLYYKLGQSQNALEFEKKALKVLVQDNQGSHLDIWRGYHNFASMYEGLGQYQKALKYHTKALEIVKAKHGEIHASTASSYMAIAGVENNLREHQKALKNGSKTLAIMESIYGKKHPSIVSSLNNVAFLESCLGQKKKALGSHLTALDITKCNYGEKHSFTADSYKQLVIFYSNRKKYREALKYAEKALEIKKSVYGKEHPEIADAEIQISLVYKNLEDYSAALGYQLKALKTLKLVYGETHPEIATSYSNLADIFEKKGEIKRAIENHLKALEVLKSIFGDFHPKMMASYDKLLNLYVFLGEHNKVLEYKLKILQIQELVSCGEKKFDDVDDDEF